MPASVLASRIEWTSRSLMTSSGVTKTSRQLFFPGRILDNKETPLCVNGSSGYLPLCHESDRRRRYSRSDITTISVTTTQWRDTLNFADNAIGSTTTARPLIPHFIVLHCKETVSRTPFARALASSSRTARRQPAGACSRSSSRRFADSPRGTGAAISSRSGSHKSTGTRALVPVPHAHPPSLVNEEKQRAYHVISNDMCEPDRHDVQWGGARTCRNDNSEIYPT